MNDEFYFATADQIYRVMRSPQAKTTLTLLDRLNAAHSDFNIDSFLVAGAVRQQRHLRDILWRIFFHAGPTGCR